MPRMALTSVPPSTGDDDVLASPRPSRVDALLTRLGVTGGRARDAALASVVAVLTLALIALGSTDTAATEGVVLTDRGILVALCTAQAGFLALRRSRPVLCLVLVVACQIGVTSVLPPDLNIRAFAPLVAGYTVGLVLPTSRALAVTGVAVLVEAVGATLVATADGRTVGELLLQHAAGAALSYPLLALVGSSIATRRRYLDLLRLRAVEAVRAQQATARAAVVAERSRMARELHDVAAHHLSGMVVQAAAVERLVDRDPAAAKEGAAWLRRQGKQTLDDLRLVVGVLREGPEDGRAPVPGLADLPELVATAQALGAAVTLDRTGPPVTLGPLADAALYRAAQEALANARQHAVGAPVRVTLRTGDGVVTLEVVNGVPEAAGPVGRPTREGAGLIGMRERAQLVGATLAVGPTPDGGWAVRVRLPVPTTDVTTTDEEQG
jgi:signal transduction histidine kinase